MERTAVITLLLAGATACVPGEGPMMRPFEDCLGCHSSSGDAKSWTVAGTWRKGAEVTVTDANGKSVTMRGNDVGNFYTAEPLTFPVVVSVDGKFMPDRKDPTITPGKLEKPELASCNMCHRAEVVTVGPEMLPGDDCLRCHSASGVASDSAFSAAGTFPPPRFPVGTRVSVGGQSTTTNAVGNFYLTTPIAGSPPAVGFSSSQPASVGGSSMEGGTRYGGCNACHRNGVAGD